MPRTRTATIDRTTNETQIKLRLNLSQESFVFRVDPFDVDDSRSFVIQEETPTSEVRRTDYGFGRAFAGE